MALLSPLGMIVFRNTFNQSEKMGEEEANAVLREAAGDEVATEQTKAPSLKKDDE